MTEAEAQERRKHAKKLKLQRLEGIERYAGNNDARFVAGWLKDMINFPGQLTRDERVLMILADDYIRRRGF